MKPIFLLSLFIGWAPFAHSNEPVQQEYKTATRSEVRLSASGSHLLNGLTLLGVSKLNGKDYVVVKRADGESFYLWGNGSEHEGIRLRSVNLKEVAQNTTVYLQAGDTVGEIGFTCSETITAERLAALNSLSQLNNTVAAVPQDPKIVAHEKSFRRSR